ncbi:class I SAM-dependent methyltransferase [Candidatus Pacearchaeota archaeon]|nr:class I SAM-dependent methyltransferase [Candidatus Pacearchaeota archaeon]
MELTQKQIVDKYDKFAKKYNRSESFFEFLVLNRIRKLLFKNLRGKILEVGVGTGKNFKYYSSDSKITALDSSNEMMKIARRESEKYGLKVDFIQGSVVKLPFKKNRFDFVVDSLGLCTYPDKILALKEMRRVCKKNGKIILLEHGISKYTFIKNIQYKLRKFQMGFLGCDLVINPLELVKKAGLKIVFQKITFMGIIYCLVLRD